MTPSAQPPDEPTPGAGTRRLAGRLLAVSRLLDRVALGVLWFSAAGLVAMTLIIGWHVFARRILNDTPHWSETGSVLIMFWYSLLGAAIGVRSQGHIGLVFFRDLLPRGGRLAFDVLINLLVAAFGAALLWYGNDIMQTTWNQDIPTVGVSVGILYLPFPLAGVLIIAFAFEHVLRTLAGQEVTRGWS